MSDSENSAITSDEEQSPSEIKDKHSSKKRKLDNSKVDSQSGSSDEEYDSDEEEDEEEEANEELNEAYERPTRAKATREKIKASGFILEEAG